MSDTIFELPVHFDARHHASRQERKLRMAARKAGDVQCRHRWYGMKLVGAEAQVLAVLADLAGVFKFGRLRPRTADSVAPSTLGQPGDKAA